MAKKFTLDGEVGWEITTRVVKGILHKANGEDIDVDFSSPGGSVYEGIKVFNLFKNYSGKVNFNIVGLAASMGSYIVLAGDSVTAEANAIYMIHNVWTYTSGDHKDLRETADLIERLSRMLSREYTIKTGISAEDIEKMMDADTYLIGGQAILEAGFVDSVNGEEDPDPDAKTISLAAAKESFNACMLKVRDEKPDDYEQVAALLPQFESNAGSLLTDIKPVQDSRDNHKTEVTKVMDVNEVKAKHAETAAALVAEGVAAERDRINAHLIMGKASGDMDTAMAAVEDGSEMTATIMAKYNAAAMNKNALGAHAADSDAAGDSVDGVAVEADVETEADVVATELEKQFGVMPDKGNGGK